MTAGPQAMRKFSLLSRFLRLASGRAAAPQDRGCERGVLVSFSCFACILVSSVDLMCKLPRFRFTGAHLLLQPFSLMSGV